MFENGFAITDEALVRDRDRVYQIIVAQYDGIVRTASDVELWLGKSNIERGGEELRALAVLYSTGIEKKIKGYAETGRTDDRANDLLAEFRKLSGAVN